ncbi:hypothetical protein TIFTF001_014822 [Ficus carica]|uniref:Uncharacterized protein n=1 Tax=Ficus carica TaxID=3494 RepID=A0AA88A3F2_FICCA|nr:hypothetical protein TIFTF001_014822 [Ficus carica]
MENTPWYYGRPKQCQRDLIRGGVVIVSEERKYLGRSDEGVSSIDVLIGNESCVPIPRGDLEWRRWD